MNKAMVVFDFSVEEKLDGNGLFDKQTRSTYEFPEHCSVHTLWEKFNKIWKLIHAKNSKTVFFSFEISIHDNSYGNDIILTDTYNQTLKTIRFIANRLSSYDSEFEYKIVLTSPHQVSDSYLKDELLEKVKYHINWTYTFLKDIGENIRIDTFVA